MIMVFFIRFASIYIYFFFSSFGQYPLLIVVLCTPNCSVICTWHYMYLMQVWRQLALQEKYITRINLWIIASIIYKNRFHLHQNVLSETIVNHFSSLYVFTHIWHCVCNWKKSCMSIIVQRERYICI